MNFSKIDKRLLSPVYVQNHNAKLPVFISCRNAKLTKAFLKNSGIHIEEQFDFIDCFFVKASHKQIAALSNLSYVTKVHSLSTASVLVNHAKKVLSLEQVNAAGEGVGIAFIDTGLAPHCDFLIGQNRVVKFLDFVSGKKNMYDDNGHGSFVTGVCSGSGCLSGFKYAGIAPRSKIFSLKALDSDGQAKANTILSAMQWVYENHKEKNIKIVCMSFGSEPLGRGDPIMKGAEALWQEGVTVVAAAGNSGPEFETIKSPGISPQIITVGGIDDKRNFSKSDASGFFKSEKKNFEMANFSSRGPAFRQTKPDLVAPSVDIISCGRENDYCMLSGTSVATPMVAGLCALIVEKAKEISPNRVKNILLSTCQSLGFESFAEGYGLPDVSKLF